MAAIPTPTEQPATILVNVVSPSSEVPNRLSFSNVPITDTIADLKRRIQQTVPSNPPFERQRIIYRGRALVQHNLTLQSILGSENLSTTEPYTFHLVLTPSNPPTHPAAIDPGRVSRPMGLPTPPVNILPNQGMQIPPPRPASTSQVPDGARPELPNIHNMPMNPLFNMMQPGMHPGHVDIQMQITHMGHPHSHHSHGNHTPQQLSSPMPGQPVAIPWMQDPQLQAMAQQQIQSMHDRIHQDMVNQTHQRHMAEQQSHHQSRLRDSSVPRGISNPSESNTQYNSAATSPSSFNRIPLQQASNRHIIQGGLPPGASLHPANLHAIRQNHLQNMQLDQMGPFSQLRNAIMNPLQPPRPAFSNPNQTVYLVSSAQGPQALLLSPGGTFATPGYGMYPSVMPSHLSSAPTQTSQNSRPATPAPGQLPADTQIVQGLPQGQPPQIPAAAQEDNQVGDLVRVVLPLGGHLWLLIRLLGFVYLFSSGRGWWNTILLGMLAFIGFLYQTGLLDPIIRNVWRPIREHVDRILVQQPQRPVPAAAEGSPEELANRLMARRENGNLIRQALRRVERSFILFASSLVPGVGEAQIRAREQAEREQREADEAAERARVEAEQAGLENTEQVQETGDTKEKQELQSVDGVEGTSEAVKDSTPLEQTAID